MQSKWCEGSEVPHGVKLLGATLANVAQCLGTTRNAEENLLTVTLSDRTKSKSVLEIQLLWFKKWEGERGI